MIVLEPLAPRAPTETLRGGDGALKREIWSLPAEAPTLEAFLRDVFETHWEGIRFGPLIEGAAYEWKCLSAPQSIGLLDGYLTVMFGHGGHFHLCIGENRGSERFPVAPELTRKRKPSRAQLFRGYGRDGKPVTWGFEMWNGAGEPMISIFFPNPFIEDDDSLAETPDFSRLAVWRAVSKRWLGREPEAIDEQGQGFRHG
ncbi:hypothetical protein GCM10008171_07710 [Methylopila jiangsuensis]|uniref:Uncharacterized protein n=1 Tax=Methylopila jiangsuensis TaxID=586230 RepID=A0A9W6JEH0_9HYPH|nr:hypothetical protein [Methylopila jiangsuensis]MDR6285760.1 hypothetical protein [Methylopila jiangsuensis]GLK75517.1 hypothetical protein GCM10008171_07710 [Methylopila jiangsuensis]